MRNSFIFSSEHASNGIPKEYISRFQGNEETLAGHRGYDIGIKRTAETISAFFSVPIVCGEYSRLLVDLNRSPNNRNVFSEYTRKLKEEEKKTILNKYHTPYRSDIEKRIKNLLRTNDFVYHISFHSFTPVLKGKERTNDIGILYDPNRSGEKAFAGLLKKELKKVNNSISVRFNYPYKGISDGLVTHLRKIFTNNQYAGIELEMNQKFYTNILKENAIMENLLETFKHVMTLASPI